MRKIIALLTGLFILTGSFATVTVIYPPLKASEIFFPVGKTGQKISLMELSTIKIKDFELLRGEKMKFFDRMTFKAAQKKVRDNIDRDGSINNKKILKALRPKGGETGFHFGGFALGFLLGLIGILIAYLIKDDYKRNRVKWAWIGFGIYVVLLIILFASGFAIA